MRPLIIASRPKTLIASISPVLIGTAMASRAGHFTFWVFIFTLLTGIGIQIATNFANDLYDYLKGADTPQRKGPIRVTQSGLMSLSQVKRATLSIMAFTTLNGAVLVHRGGLFIALLVVIALVLAFAYTAGPFPIAYLGIAEFFILIFFGPVAVGFTYYLQTLEFSAGAFIAGFGPGLISCSFLIINNLRDIVEDINAKKKTLVARFGTRFGKWEYAFTVIIASLIPTLFPETRYGLVLLIPAFFLLKAVFNADTPLVYNSLLGKTGQLLTLYTFFFTLSFLIC